MVKTILNPKSVCKFFIRAWQILVVYNSDQTILIWYLGYLFRYLAFLLFDLNTEILTEALEEYYETDRRYITEFIKGPGGRVIVWKCFVSMHYHWCFFTFCSRLLFVECWFFSYSSFILVIFFFCVVSFPNSPLPLLLKLWVEWKLLKNCFLKLYWVLVTATALAAK